jgi:glycosyltransferase involved in cell wall biosynthesis
MKTISVIIPTLNEEENIAPLHAELVALFASELNAYSYELLFIDNKSTDGTRAEIRKICTNDSNVRAIFNARNFGVFNSSYYGLIHTSGDCTIMLFADFQDPVSLLTEMVREWENGYKLVCCVKDKSQESKLMYLFRSFYYKLIRKMSSYEIIEHFTGFGLYDRSFVELLRDLKDPMPFLRGIVAELGPEYKTITYTQQKRRAGKSKFNWYLLYDAAMMSFTSYTKVGLRIATIFGFFMSIIGLLVALGYVILKLLFWNLYPGATIPTLISVIAFGSVQLFFIGLLGEYVMNINTRVMNRPLVIEEERIGFE